MWTGNVMRPLTVRNLFETAAIVSNFHVAHLTCNTGEELDHNLDLFRGRRGFGVLYLAFHGTPGAIELPAARFELEELADRMRTGFRSWVIHFASCSTVAVPEDRIADFLARTGAAMVMGYRNDVDWIESACTDLLLLNRLQNYVDMRRMWKAFRETYGSLVERTGLAAYPA